MSESRRDDRSGSSRSARLWITSDESPPWWLDLLGVGWVLAAAIAVMLPALIHGASLGPYGLLARDGLLQQHASGSRNPFAADQVTQMIPWTSLAWEQIHHGELPLWNPYNALGTPLAFNWQSATFSLPALLGYLVPVRLAYTTQVLATLAIGGTGCYFFGRVIHLNVVACAFAGTVFELCGTFMGWLGWPVASVMSWAGWLFAAAVLVLRGGRRVRSVAFFSLVLALAVYAGQPDTLVLLGCFLGLFVAVALLIGKAPDEGWRRRIRCLGDLFVGTAAGLALGAPLLLPGTQLLSASSRNVGGGAFSIQRAVPLPQLLAEAVPGLDGEPIGWHRAYVGVVAVALALIGLVLYRRRPEVRAIGVVAVVAGVISFTPLANSLLNHLPALGAVRWARSITFLEFAIAVLAGVGMDVLIRSFRKRAVLQLAAGVFSLAALTVAAIWVIRPHGDRIRHQNLAWAAAGAGLGLILIGLLQLLRRRALQSTSSGAEPCGDRRPARTAQLWGLGAAVLLFAFQTSFLVVMGGSQWGSTPHPFHSTTAEQRLKRAVGSSLVGLGATACRSRTTLGIPANANIVYGVRELAAYDPMLPRTYYEAWTIATGKRAGYPGTSRYCPAVRSVAMARRYGVTFVLEFHGTPGPKGMIYVEKDGNEDLYRIPAATAEATLVPAPKSGSLPPDGARGAPLVPARPDPATWKVVVDSVRPAVLRLHLTDVPGWHASIDGQPLALEPFSGVMLQARIPAGHHVIVLSYWPNAFTAGIVIASMSAVGLVTALVVGGTRRWHSLRKR